MEESTQEIETTTDKYDDTSKSYAESSEQDIIFSKSTSSASSGFPDQFERPDTDCTVEYLMTEQEIQELDKRLEEVVDRLQKQRESYEKWENSLNKRRILAYGRLQALGRFHKDRMDAYDTMKRYLNGQSSDAINKCDDSK